MINYKNYFKYNPTDTLEIIDNERYLYKEILEIKGKYNQIFGMTASKQKELEELRHFKKEVIDIIKYADDTAEPTYWNIRKLLGLGE